MKRFRHLATLSLIALAALVPASPAAQDTNPELAALIARDVSAATAGGVRAFRDTFSTRLSPADFAAAGLNEKSPAELAALDADVAFQIAAAGQPSDPLAALRFKPRSTAPTPGFAIPNLPLEVRGSVTAIYGTSRAGDFYGGGVTTTVFDPNHGWSATIGVSTLRGAVPWTYDRRRDRNALGYYYQYDPFCW